MTEDEYIIASDLARVRAAKDLVHNMSTGYKQWVPALTALRVIEAGLEERLERVMEGMGDD